MGVKIQTIKEIRFYLAKELKNLYDEPEIRILADILIKTVSGITKLHQLYDNEFTIKTNESEEIIRLTEELKTGKPIQYITGETTFYNCKIKVTSATLIPRPETEELVDLILKENKDFKGSIIDFGTGSGCIAIALAANLRKASVTGIDISEKALHVARENAVLNKVKVNFINGDIFSIDSNLAGRAGIIVSNPPYVRDSEKTLMAKNVIGFEPHQALFVTDSEPLVYYNAILKLADDMLLAGGCLYFEINEVMCPLLIQLFESYNYTDIKIVRDLNDKERIIKGRKND
jgi:release factor glutamine methyltransferase